MHKKYREQQKCIYKNEGNFNDDHERNIDGSYNEAKMKIKNLMETLVMIMILRVLTWNENYNKSDNNVLRILIRRAASTATQGTTKKVMMITTTTILIIRITITNDPLYYFLLFLITIIIVSVPAAFTLISSISNWTINIIQERKWYFSFFIHSKIAATYMNVDGERLSNKEYSSVYWIIILSTIYS